MKRGKFLIYSMLAVFVVVFFVTPANAFAKTNTHNNNFNNNWHFPNFNWHFPNFWHDNGKHNGNDHGKKKDCYRHPENPNCDPVSVPEFGLIPGVVAFMSSAGAFYALRRRVK
jgi:hypothetical protein